MKTKEELTAIKEEVAALNAKLAELTEDELKEVTGGGRTIRRADPSTGNPNDSGF